MGIAPNGAFHLYLSKLWSGSTIDRKIVQESDLIDLSRKEIMSWLIGGLIYERPTNKVCCTPIMSRSRGGTRGMPPLQYDLK